MNKFSPKEIDGDYFITEVVNILRTSYRVVHPTGKTKEAAE